MSDALAIPELPVSNHPKWYWLRISVSVFFGLLTVALCVLWVRSYWWSEGIEIRRPLRISYAAWERGELFLVTNSLPVKIRSGWSFRHGRIYGHEPPPGETVPAFYFSTMQGGFAFTMPLWFMALGAALCGAASQFRWSKRFRLRTLLIATTLVAVVLGLVVYAASK